MSRERISCTANSMHGSRATCCRSGLQGAAADTGTFYKLKQPCAIEIFICAVDQGTAPPSGNPWAGRPPITIAYGWRIIGLGGRSIRSATETAMNYVLRQ